MENDVTVTKVIKLTDLEDSTVFEVRTHEDSADWLTISNDYGGEINIRVTAARELAKAILDVYQ